jgi:adenine-specific DNA-methyltransferase
VSSFVNPTAFKDAEVIGFENHLNVFHENKKGLSEPLAKGLTLYLNTSCVDDHFRLYSGHTQVNATDLKLMKYPSRENLITIGQWAISLANEPSQDMIRAQFKNLKS